MGSGVRRAPRHLRGLGLALALAVAVGLALAPALRAQQARPAAAATDAARAPGGTWYVAVTGLGGEPDYDQEYAQLAADLTKALASAGGTNHVTVLSGANATRARLTDSLQAVAREAQPDDDFALILIGHGTFDGIDYKFNLPGPDITASELATLLDAIRTRRQLVVLATSASGGAIAALERPGRGIIAATKDGNEKNAVVFGRYFVAALQDPDADTDKNEATSALEAFEYATAKTAEFYQAQKRLATEHAVFEDTGKAQPVRAVADGSDEGRLLSTFTLVRFGALQKAYADPAKQQLLAQKEDLERKIDALKYQKAAMDDADYKEQLTALLVQLAKVQQQIDQ